MGTFIPYSKHIFFECADGNDFAWSPTGIKLSSIFSLSGLLLAEPKHIHRISKEDLSKKLLLNFSVLSCVLKKLNPKANHIWAKSGRRLTSKFRDKSRERKSDSLCVSSYHVILTMSQDTCIHVVWLSQVTGQRSLVKRLRRWSHLACLTGH